MTNKDREAGRPKYERSDANPRVIGALGLVIIGLIGAAVFAAKLLVPSAEPIGIDRTGASGFQRGAEQQSGIAIDWANEDEEVHSHLVGYGWVDRDLGVVHIPIEKAFDRMLADSGKHVQAQN